MTISKLIEFSAFTLFIACSALSLSGCGNKGPLYIPPPPVKQESLPAEQDTPQPVVPGEEVSEVERPNG